jgi:hypothetical protein
VAVLLPRAVRTQVITDAVASAERLAVGAGETAIYDVHDYGLKGFVQVTERCVWILTRAEAARAGLPERPPLPTEN